MKIDGKSALVFGGARGLGKICAQLLLSQGAKVCIADIRAEEGESSRNEFDKEFPGKISFTLCDVTKENDVNDTFEFAKSNLGSLDICFNAAGIIDEINWRKMVDINFISVVIITQAAMEWMGTDKKGSGGILIHTASYLGLAPNPIIPVYAATKHAMVGYVRSYGKDLFLNKTGVRVNCVNPFFMNTLLIPEGKGLDQSAYDAIVTQKVKFGNPNDVAEAMRRLIEDESLNGECMVVSRDKGVFLDDDSKIKMYEGMW